MSREKFPGVGRLFERLLEHTHSSGGTITSEPTLRTESPSDHERTFIPADYIIVDDQEYQARQTEMELREALSLSSGEQVRRVASVTELFQIALPLNGDQPKAIFLDDDLSDKANEFTLNPSLFEGHENLPRSLFGYPDSVKLAWGLRIAGYGGRVIIRSNYPPTAEEIQSRTDEFNAEYPHFRMEFPINGYSLKETKLYASGRRDTGEWDSRNAVSTTAAVGNVIVLNSPQA